MSFPGNTWSAGLLVQCQDLKMQFCSGPTLQKSTQLYLGVPSTTLLSLWYLRGQEANRYKLLFPESQAGNLFLNFIVITVNICTLRIQILCKET